MTGPTFGSRVEHVRSRFSEALTQRLPPATQYPARLHEAMHYATAGGKRLRPLIVYAAAETLALDARQVDAAACAIEMIHAYSLVHDDLPSMDDDDLRRGQPTVHRKFDEATAILVGDALQSLAFRVIAREEALDPAQRVKMIETLSEAAGSRGMVGGQAIDLESEGKQLSLAELEALHIHKTGAIILACLRLACHAQPDLDAARCEALDRYGKCIGLAFQIQDDVLDIEGDTATLGKTAGKDEASHKSTYPAVMGLRAAKERAAELFCDARLALSGLGDAAEPLRWIAAHIERREH
ncbi:farnesyl-diphosphate synthase [Panacagrimonas perspica]|uniref:Farnesyl-diphosphate synthase n=1 Tax=Panacagrimonas perspica TaxID=381431 RepID=A0A4R7PA36_9GAMM|nr:farnesyl diphosphate synthase [Panacagrimonas perspica]TDU30883.1 farnesyl-diphosphate synthase [Panacagrimonas perspica]THD01959.1 geranyl transferase [Panacagrimonas perspica]